MTREEQLELVQAVRLGDEKAFERLHAFLRPILYRSVYGMLSAEDADDCVQDAMLRIFRKLDQFKGDASFSTWCVTVAKNSALMIVRKRKIDFSYFPQSIDETSTDQQGNEHKLFEPSYEDRTAEQNLARETVHTGLAAIKEEQRIAVLMQMNGEDVETIAASLNRSIGATKSILLRGKAALAEVIRNPYAAPKARGPKPKKNAVLVISAAP